MLKKDDCTLSHSVYEKIRREAKRILIESNAIGRFPTPVADIMDVAKVEVVDDNILDEGFLSKIRKKAGRALKKAISVTLGVLDVKGRFVFVDKTVHAVRQTFIKIHEAGHFIMAWQRKLYSIVEDCEKTISTEIEDHFDREANVFTSEVLFQLDTFSEEAENHGFGIQVPIRLSKKYGASIYASIRRYVSKNWRACAVLVLDPPELMAGCGFKAGLRRVVYSDKFIEVFGKINWPEQYTPDDEIGSMVPVGGRRMSAPREIGLKNDNGELCECIAEAFTQTYQVFILIHAVKTLKPGYCICVLTVS
ncbi:hypothetical protein DSCW_48930 [Desulfosarcina widdelii]|uniref:IrrE N-terminal-like domain-containing protein n=1 Tax=Desulfosarcina widdelii TaxID=947919 RepID=A0A5K7Z6P5_9BACT|nr:ImmA/IrrE family metallo-endopeptidase [Desulfosarcina widdelii]BBO77476.1 hypothetical protein DSCW_48930 [Desulfosarcina widdelii]